MFGSVKYGIEFSVLIRSDLKRKGLGKKLLTEIINYCRSRGIKHLTGMALAENPNILPPARKLKFKTRFYLEAKVGLLDLSLRH